MWLPNNCVWYSPGAAQPPAQDAAGRYPPLRDEAALPGGEPPPSQRAHVPPHLRHQSAQAQGGPQRCGPGQRHCWQPCPGRSVVRGRGKGERVRCLILKEKCKIIFFIFNKIIATEEIFSQS